MDEQLRWTRDKVEHLARPGASNATPNTDGKGQQDKMQDLENLAQVSALVGEGAHEQLREGHEPERRGLQEEAQGLWSVVGLLLHQFDGLLAGYNARAKVMENAVLQPSAGGGHCPLPRLTSTDLLVLSGVGAPLRGLRHSGRILPAFDP